MAGYPKRGGVPDPVDVHVGRRLRLRRVELGMSQQKVSASSGVSYQQIQKYEQGKNRISASMLWRLGSVLGVPISYFFEDLPVRAPQPAKRGLAEGAQAPYNGDILGNRETLELARAYGQIPDPQVRKSVRQLLTNVVKSMKRQTA